MQRNECEQKKEILSAILKNCGMMFCEYLVKEDRLIFYDDTLTVKKEISDYLEYLNTGPEEQRFRHKAVEALFEMVYMRLLESYCDTPEQRYVKLMQRCPNLKEKVPLKEIASFLGVTPETVSHIRKKLSYPEKS